MDIRTVSFWDLFFSEGNMRAIVGSFSEAIPIALTAIFTIIVTLVTTGVTDRRRRRETKALADAALVERISDRNREERRQDDAKWHEEIRSAAIRMLTASMNMASAREQRRRIEHADQGDHPDLDFDLLLHDSDEVIQKHHRELSNDVSALLIFAPTSLYEVAQEFVSATLDAVKAADDDLKAFEEKRARAGASFLVQVRIHLHVDEPLI